MQEPGKPGDASAATPEGEIRGDLKIGQPVEPEGAMAGETRKLAGRRRRRAKVRGDPEIHHKRAGRCGNRGNLSTHREAIFEAGIWGDPKTRSDESRRAWDAGKLEEQDAGNSLKGCRRRGNPQPHPRLTGDDDPVSCMDIRKAPGMKVSGAFDFSDRTPLRPGADLSERDKQLRISGQSAMRHG